MNLDNLLRDYARQDLQRFCPNAHYWNRDHNPIADRELIEPLLREPVRFGLTPRERVAATALGYLTTYTIKSRAILAAAYPARDCDDPTPTTGTTFDQEREIWGRRECFRDSAFVYARMLGDVQLIEHYQTPMQAPTTDPAPAQSPATPAPVETVEQRRARYLALLEHEEKSGKHGALTRVASREGVDRSNMSKDIEKARAARASQTRAGAWASQLVQDGKRQN